ncbi:conserved hypothetical protein [Candida albicans WO-1]|uniref:Uncharacterized protein n=1 Tax=Candida albicans (strain WO-1) TaxID=294748 RepID=C4YNV2_CANAW|nr:conserved hypothetical protein [Candida albicans WO-1]KGQ88187.1 hypothetical protein MEO_02995 [Candida albicans P94015]KGU30810.1 hypothetical protein MGK_03030 [Candida albicans P57055]
MFLIIPLIIFSLLSIGQSLFIPTTITTTTTTTTTTITIEADNSNLITLSTGPQLIENENYIKITKSTDLNQLFRKYPRGEIVNDFNDVDDLNARIFIFDMANLLEDLFE